jgi:MFS transporter, DHA2 family, multidrug resistance protein
VEKVGTKRVVLAGLTLITVGLLLLSTIAPDSPYPLVISYFVIMAAGMGMTMAPATESVMGSLPREKAGVGSAVNDTTRQVGGALGVAIIGSAVSSVWASRIGALSGKFGLDASNTTAAESSLGGAQRVGGDLGSQASAFVAEANQIFVDAMAIGMRIAFVVVGIAAVMVWKFLPARAHDDVGHDHVATPVAGDTIADAKPTADSVAVAPPATATLSAGD